MAEHLYIYGPQYGLSQWQGNTENMQWLEILYPFTAVKIFYMSEDIAQNIAPALEYLFVEISGHGDLSRKLSGSFLLRDSTPVTL
jgi:hypothetical protein